MVDLALLLLTVEVKVMQTVNWKYLTDLNCPMYKGLPKKKMVVIFF